MFDPDNFYEILKCKYSWPLTPNLLLHFHPHGSKKLETLKVLLDNKKFNNEFTKDDYVAVGKIILHDQEPFFFTDAVHTYRQFLQDNKIHPRYQEIAKSFTASQLITYAFQSTLQPIFCHSELNSSDINTLTDDCLFIECYYWYHAMIARDWFRHWQYHPDLHVKDRSDSPYRFMFYARGLDGTRQYRKKFINLINPFKSKIFLGQQTSQISSDYSAKISTQDANFSAIHIILETLFETSKIHLTEKVFKPMVMGQPFFLLAPPGSLKYLRSYGFKTFGDFWDERYDDILDHNDRMAYIIQEIEKILRLSPQEFKSLYRSMIPVIAHNQHHFFSREFQDYCIQEMENNFKTALDTQQKNINVYPGGPFLKMIDKFVKEDDTAWPERFNSIKGFLNSKYLQVSKEKISETYPNLSKRVFY